MSLPDPSELARRIEGQFDRSRLPTFDEATFLASLAGFKGNMQSGNLDLTFSVGPGEKYAALAVTDAPAEQLVVTVRRLSLREVRDAAKASGEVAR